MLKIRLSDYWLPACEVFFFFLGRGGAAEGWGVVGCRLTQQRSPLSFEWAPWDCDSAPVAGRALTSARRGSADASLAPGKALAPLRLKKKKKKLDYHFWWSTFSQTAVINENGRERNCLTMTAIACEFVSGALLWFASATETRVCVLKSRVMHKNCAGRRQEKFIMGCFKLKTDTPITRFHYST